jgi:HPr kinase/phosphorylase
VSEPAPLLFQATCIAIDGRAVLIEGAPGSGKSSLALTLIDRGAQLIGDDGVQLVRRGDHVIAIPPPNISGMLEVRGVGLFELPVCDGAPVSLILALGEEGPRLPDTLDDKLLLNVPIPRLPFEPGPTAPAIRAELALARHGLAAPGEDT